MPVHRSDEKDGTGSRVFDLIVEDNFELAFLDEDQFLVRVSVGFMSQFAGAQGGGVALQARERAGG